jgi:two-component system, cell cycle sensor histidine kinase and response regulator CckA
VTDRPQADFEQLRQQLRAAQETVDALKKAAELHSKSQAPDHFAVRKAMANLQNTLAVRDRELERSEQRYRAIFDHSPLMTFIVDEKGRITDVNRTALDALTVQRHQVLGSPLAELFPPEGRQVIQQLLDTEIPNANLKLPLNKERLADASIASVPGFSGRQVLLRDITEQQVIEAQLQHSQRMEAIGQLAGGVAHDINNMLCGVLGFSELLRDRLHDAKALSYNNQIMRSCENANELVNRLLAFARRGPLQAGSVDLKEVVNSVTSIIERTFDRRVHVEAIMPDKPVIVLGDAAQLESVLLNLALNARDAMPNGGKILIELRSRRRPRSHSSKQELADSFQSSVEIMLTDEGPGIPEEYLNRIFEPFFTTKPVGKGTGLGLSAAYGTMKQHDGSLTVRNGRLGGCTFTMHLPNAVHEPVQGKKTTAPTPAAASGLILFVDDDHAVRTSSAKLLKGIGYDVLVADCGRAGVEMFHKHADEIQVVLLDMVMPDLHGTEVLKRIRAIRGDANVLAISGYSGGKDFYGADGFLPKPFTIAELSQALAALVPCRPSSSA